MCSIFKTEGQQIKLVCEMHRTLPVKREWYIHVYRSLRATITKERQNNPLFCQERWGGGGWVFCHFLQNTSMFCFRRPPLLLPGPVLPRDWGGGGGGLLKQSRMFRRKCQKTPPPNLLVEQVLMEDGVSSVIFFRTPVFSFRCLPFLQDLFAKRRGGGSSETEHWDVLKKMSGDPSPSLLAEQVLPEDGGSSETEHWDGLKKMSEDPPPPRLFWQNTGRLIQ